MHRWTATVTYNTESGPLEVVHDLTELEELHDLVERGPHWGAISDIRIALAEDYEVDRLTVEEASRL